MVIKEKGRGSSGDVGIVKKGLQECEKVSAYKRVGLIKDLQ